jgi:hypothetical protein
MCKNIEHKFCIQVWAARRHIDKCLKIRKLPKSSLMRLQTKTNSVAWVRERAIPTERPPLVSELSAKFTDTGVPRGQHDGSPRLYSHFSIPRIDGDDDYKILRIFNFFRDDSITENIDALLCIYKYFCHNIGLYLILLSRIQFHVRKLKSRDKERMYVITTSYTQIYLIRDQGKLGDNRETWEFNRIGNDVWVMLPRSRMEPCSPADLQKAHIHLSSCCICTSSEGISRSRPNNGKGVWSLPYHAFISCAFYIKLHLIFLICESTG